LKHYGKPDITRKGRVALSNAAQHGKMLRMSTDKTRSLRDALIRNFLRPAEVTHFSHGQRYESADGELVNRSVIKKLGAAITTLPPGKLPCPYHLHHAQTEMFIVVEGTGTLRVAGEAIPIGPGDVITIPPGPEYPHQIINNSDAPLKYISLSTQEWPEICDYPDSEKTLASSGASSGPRTRMINRVSGNVNYWDGEA
jgi:uncharacterized cupin superfamily protein